MTTDLDSTQRTKFRLGGKEKLLSEREALRRFQQHERSIDSTLLRRPEVEACTGLRRAAIYMRIADGLLSGPIKIGVRVSGWPAREITAVNEALIAGRSDDEIRQLVKDLVDQRTAGAGS